MLAVRVHDRDRPIRRLEVWQHLDELAGFKMLANAGADRLDHSKARDSACDERFGKERRRQGLLTETLARDKIRHHVVSRFAVITDDPGVINYNQLGMRAQAIIAEAG